MKKCQHCGAPLQDGDRFCQACGAEQLPEEESKKRICPECGKWIQADGKFCPFCGAELPEMDDDEPVIDEATGTETFVHKHREPVRDEEPPRSPQPMERPVMTGRPTPPPFQEPPFYVRYRKGIITAVVVLILAVAAAVAFHFYGSRSSGDYVKDAVSLSQQLSSENESVTDTAKRLSQKSKGDDVDSLVKDLGKSRKNVEKMAKNYQPKNIPDQYASDDQAIREVMRDQMAMYDTAIAIAENPKDDAISEKLDDLRDEVQKAKKTARTIKVPGADFTGAVDGDNLVSYLEKYVSVQTKPDETPQPEVKADPDKQVLSSYASSKDLFNDDIGKLAGDINAYLSNHPDFKGTREFTSRANTLYIQISKTRNQLENDTSIDNTAMKYKLDALFQAEQDRIRGLYDGVSASQRGQDYRPGFQRGQAASNRYDKLNDEWNNL
ncbi:zinc ribbon domain-containing protein [Megasphaera elsdenii]|uniref:zinc ribbon domain-containing protein n=1 Tax=Megasphaera elsdenii TaxID=907 RepID=UPI00242A9618|nr:zinc ribbon domain-containing protein [Megasphaera elsdenii]